jgi:C4-dicarboxylate transporter DctM subunit
VSVATAATIGTVAIPEMINRGYERRFVLGLIAAGGTLGILIPPSIPLILFGDIAEQSISDLFLAGIGPGILLALLFIIYALVRTRVDGTVVIERATWVERRSLSLRALPTVALAALIFTGLYGGAFTPTEAAAIGFALSVALTTLLLRTLNWALFKEAVMEAMQTTVSIFLIIAGAKIFARAITLYRIPQDLSSAITSTITEAGLFVFVVSFVLLLLGFFMDPISLLLILVPLLLPALAALGVDPIWFGILFVVLIECALITPPVGLNLFVIQATSKASLVEITQGVWPFVILMLLAVFVMFWLPDIALYIPFKL